MPTYQKVVEMVRLSKESKLKCMHPKCDGRPARWWFPQAPGWFPQAPLDSAGAKTAGAKTVACNAHLAAVATIMEEWHVEPTTVPGTGCDG